ncbi:MAG: IPT/TIG domain-containing protein [Prevotella sp.]|jgi:hypothetical protein|nr:IPT/TIG domain-containing protein [Prevotella sp.]
MKKTILTTLIIYLGLCISCKDDNTDFSTIYDPNEEMKVISFLPDSGGARTQIVIEGVNFGSDTSLIRVEFSEKRIPATIIGANGSSIYCLVPPGQPDGKNDIYVTVGDQKSHLADQKFRYVVKEQVSLITGQPDRGGDTDGSLSTALFWQMFAVFCVDGGSLITFGDGNPRLISPKDNTVITLQNGVRILNGCMTKDRKTVYGVSLNYPHALYKYTKEGLWRPELVTSLIDIDRDLFACTLDDTEEWIYFYVTLWAEVWKMELKNPSNIQKVCTVGSPVGYWGGITYSYFEDCFYIGGFDLSGIYKISKDGSNVQNYAGFHGFNYSDGLAKDAGIPHPAGIIADKEGNIYFTDVEAGTIRRLDYRTQMITTIAGQPYVHGNTDGLPKESTFCLTYGIDIDEDGSIYVTNSYGHFGTIRKIAIE